MSWIGYIVLRPDPEPFSTAFTAEGFYTRGSVLRNKPPAFEKWIRENNRWTRVCTVNRSGRAIKRVYRHSILAKHVS